MALAENRDVRFVAHRSKAAWMLGAEAFIRLGPADRQVLANRLATAAPGRTAQAAKIDRVIDLARRPWNVAGSEVVLGIFEAGRAAASCLLVRYGGRWVLAEVAGGAAGGSASEDCDSLAEALGLIGAARPD